MHKNHIKDFIKKNEKRIATGVVVTSGVALAAAGGLFVGRFILQNPAVIIDEAAVDKMYRIQNGL